MVAKDAQKESISLQFKEEMAGFIAATDDFFIGEKRGREEGNYLSFAVTIFIQDIENFYKLSGRKASLEGFISSKIWGEKIPIRQGEFTLFVTDRETGQKRLVYSFPFRGKDGQDYFLYGYKIIQHDPGRLDFGEDLTSLYTRIYRGSLQQGVVWGAGILRFKVSTLPAMLASCSITPAQPLGKKIKILTQFFSFLSVMESCRILI